MNYFLTKTCSNFNNKYNCGVRHSSLKRRKELQKFFTEIRNETIDSSKSEYKKKRFIKIKDKEIQGLDVNKYNIDKDNVYSKIRSLSNKQVSIKLMKMLQQKA
jgi:glycosylphosphatidylinositol transamidase (GPIT) subunit GPI8